MEASRTFAPDFQLRRLSRRSLAVLAREYQLAAHLQDRAAMPQVRLRWGGSAMREIAIAEWMAAINLQKESRSALACANATIAADPRACRHPE